MTSGCCDKELRTAAPVSGSGAENAARRVIPAETAFGCPRDFLDNRFVYVVISPRARGLSIGVNMTPDRTCNFDCLYCEVNRSEPAREMKLDMDVMAAELERTLEFVLSGAIRERAPFSALPEDLLILRHVALSGDGEPTQSEEFVEVVERVMHLRAKRRFPFFKIVLITNATGLDRAEVQRGIKYFTQQDEIWAKIEAGSQEFMNLVNRPTCGLDKVLGNVLQVARQRPVVIQSLFASIQGISPSDEEVNQYVGHLAELKKQGARIPLVQIYSATRPTPHSECGHLPLKVLSAIAQAVRKAGLPAEVF
jgi:wyosine [tRNA(Phe)-imidazoG37] synthetase (radical SAM superfamily)